MVADSVPTLKWFYRTKKQIILANLPLLFMDSRSLQNIRAKIRLGWYVQDKPHLVSFLFWKAITGFSRILKHVPDIWVTTSSSIIGGSKRGLSGSWTRLYKMVTARSRSWSQSHVKSSSLDFLPPFFFAPVTVSMLFAWSPGKSFH